MRARHTGSHELYLMTLSGMHSWLPLVSHLVHAGVPIGLGADTHSESSMRMHTDNMDSRKGGPNSPPAPTQEPWPRVPARSSTCGGVTLLVKTQTRQVTLISRQEPGHIGRTLREGRPTPPGSRATPCQCREAALRQEMRTHHCCWWFPEVGVTMLAFTQATLGTHWDPQ